MPQIQYLNASANLHCILRYTIRYTVLRITIYCILLYLLCVLNAFSTVFDYAICMVAPPLIALRLRALQPPFPYNQIDTALERRVILY